MLFISPTYEDHPTRRPWCTHPQRSVESFMLPRPPSWSSVVDPFCRTSATSDLKFGIDVNMKKIPNLNSECGWRTAVRIGHRRTGRRRPITWTTQQRVGDVCTRDGFYLFNTEKQSDINNPPALLIFCFFSHRNYSNDCTFRHISELCLTSKKNVCTGNYREESWYMMSQHVRTC